MNTGDTAWVLASAALVMLMTPGLAFFYGGMVRSKSVLNMLMMNFIALAVVTVLWMLYGYSEAFGNDAFGGLVGNFDNAGLAGTFGQLTGTVGQLTRSWQGPPDPGAGVRHVPADVRGHHAGADLRRDRRPHQVLVLGDLPGRLGHRRLLPGRALGVRLRLLRRLASSAAGWPTRSRRSTSPAAPRSISTPAPRVWRWRWCSAAARAGRRSRCVRTTCRSCCWAPACCGSAGTASTPAPHWPPATSPPSRSPRPPSPPPPPCSAG